MAQRQKVVIVGGGIAGLTAAHELIERDFEVHVYERRDFFGGKAASTRDNRANKAAGGARHSGFPCEHGFRFYPAWYRHLPDTMARIPYQGTRAYQDAKTVLDNLVPVDNELLTWFGRDPVKILSRLPRTLDQAKTLRAFLMEFAKLGLAPGEMAFFAHRMAQFLVTPDARRAEQWESVTWWDYLEAGTKSPAYRDLIAATTRLMIAAKATEASAYTIGRLALRTFSDALATVDRVMTGPTNELWIEPWVDHLKGLGVVFHTGVELDEVDFEDGNGGPQAVGLLGATKKTPYLNRIKSVSFTRVIVLQARRLARLLPTIAWAASGLLSPDATTDVPGEQKHDARWFRRDLEDTCESIRSLIGVVSDDAFWKSWEFDAAIDQANSQARGKGRTRAYAVAVRALLDLLTRNGDSPFGVENDVSRPRGFLEPLIDAAVNATHGNTGEADVKWSDVSRLAQSYSTWWEEFSVLLVQRLAPQGLVDLEVGLETTTLSMVQAPPAASAERRLEAIHACHKGWQRMAAAAAAPANVALLKNDLPIVLSESLQVTVRLLQLLDRTDFASAAPDKAEYFVFALPLEQMAYYANRCTAMLHYDPSLRRLIRLSEYMDWMAGIQFYLKEPFRIVAGHIVCMDSNWSLTAVEHTQFWRDIDLRVKVGDADAEIKAVVSVDIASWDRKGRFINKEAFNCTDDEIATEVWEELKAAIERHSTTTRLRDDMLLGYRPGGPTLRRNVNYHLDDSIADVYDRKKQAAYENARSVAFSADDLVQRQGPSGTPSPLPYVWGARRQFNVEPLLVNRAGSLALRPEAKTAIPNMFLAGDYVRTETDLACMEGANEAARLAVNALLDAAASKSSRCETWPLSIARDVLERLAQLGPVNGAWGVGARAAQTAGQVTDALMSFATQAVADLQSLSFGTGNGRPRPPPR